MSDKIDLDKTYYYSGPMTGYERYNYDQFENDVETLRALGLKIESPHENEWPEGAENLPVAALWAQMMAKAVVQMGKCQGIIMMKGWPQSRGAVFELNHAIKENWPVYFYDDYVLTSMNKQGVI